MREFLKKNFTLVLAFVLPITLMVIIALSTYLPSFFLSTDYNFVYSVCTDGTNYYSSRCDNYLKKRYSVINNKLVVNDVDLSDDGRTGIDASYTARLFLHDTKKNESREITIDEAQALTLNNLLTSPDGVTVSGHYERYSFLFFGSESSHGRYLTKGANKKILNLVNYSGRHYYTNNFQFIGWVLPGRN